MTRRDESTDSASGRMCCEEAYPADDPAGCRGARLSAGHGIEGQCRGVAASVGCVNEHAAIRKWQMLVGTLVVRVAAVSGVLILATLMLMLAMERFVRISERLR